MIIRRSSSHLVRAVALATLVGVAGTGCSGLIVGTAADVMQDMLVTVNDQRDPELVRDAIPAQLLQVEGIAALSPGHVQMETLVAQSFCSYALVFLMDENRQRAERIFAQGKEHAFLAMDGIDDEFTAIATGGNGEAMAKLLDGLDADDVPTLFWTGNCWAGEINASGGSPRALAGLPKVEQMMRRALDLDETYYFGGPHLFMGMYYASRPKLLGGDPEKSNEHFQRVFEITEGKFLLAKVFYAQFYAKQVQDPKLFEATLEEVLAAPDDILPGERLVTAVAKQKAEELLDQMDDLF